MYKALLPLFLVWMLLGDATANDQLRTWTLAGSGEKRNGEILAYDEASGEMTLRLADQTKATYQEKDFSMIDRAWILEWTEFTEEAKATLARLGGTVQVYRSKGEYPTDFAVYTPPGAEAVAERPMLILFHPGGNGQRRIYAYVEAAAATGMTLVSLDTFRNTGTNFPGAPEEEELLKRFKELLPQIEATVPHDLKRVYMGGTSGGAWRAYHYAAYVKRPWAGIFASGGWLGGKQWYDLDYPAMRVAMVNGDKDHAANHHVEPDSVVLQRAGCTVSIHAFEGGHQMPPTSVQRKAMVWLLSGVARDEVP